MADWERQKTAPAAPARGKLRLKPRDWLILGLAALVLCLLVLGGALLVAQRETVFPGVTVRGTDVSGLNLSRATAVAKLAGWDGAERTVLTASLPGDETLEISSGTAGWSASAHDAAQAAWDYGRSGNLVTNFFAWVRSAVFGYDAAKALSDPVDAEALRAQVDEAVRRVNLSLDGGNLEVDAGAQQLRLIKGAELLLLDTDETCQMITAALESHQTTVDCVPKPAADAAAEAFDLQKLHDEICGDPVNAYYDVAAGEVAEATPGVQFDVAEAQRRWDAAGVGETVEIPAVITPAAFQKSDVPGLYCDMLSVKSTFVSGGYNRVNNVRLAAQKIDGLILMPGQSFSYNDAVGQRTLEAGFLEAGAYTNGKVIQEVGGGICQVSSTLYYCTLIANLKIVQRSNHYFSVGYIEPGMDATVSWGGPDFQFENNRTFPIVLHAGVDENGYLTVSIWGTDVDGSTVAMDYALNGLVAVTYRHVFDRDGNLLSSEQEAVSVYHSHNEAENG